MTTLYKKGCAIVDISRVSFTLCGIDTFKYHLAIWNTKSYDVIEDWDLFWKEGEALAAATFYLASLA